MSLALTLALAMVLDAVLGEPDWLWARLPHPAVLMGRAVGWMESRFNRGTLLRMNGVAVMIVLVAGAVFVGLALASLGPIVQILCAAIVLAQRSLVQHVSAVADATRLSVADGRRMVARIVSRDCSEMTQSQVARAAIESGSENLSDGVIAPAFWFLIGGLPGLLVYKIVNTADSMIGYRTARYEQFGWAAARFDDLLNLVPARLTGALIAALSAGIGQWGAIVRDARLHRSPNAGWPEAAMARALNIALAGPRSYDGTLRPFPWVNDSGQKEIGPDQIDASVSILWYVWWAVLTGLGVISILLWAAGRF